MSITLSRKKPMQRSAFKLAGAKTQMRRSGIKARVKKPTVAEGSKYLAACRGESCYLRVLEVCNRDRETVVPCHSNQSRHGKGMGIKAKNEFSVPGCRACHAWIDQGPAPREHKFSVWDSAFERWLPVRAQKMGIETNQEEFA